MEIHTYTIPFDICGLFFYKNYKNYIHGKNLYTFGFLGYCLQFRTDIKEV